MAEHDGNLLYFNGGYRIPVNDKFDMKLGAHVTWADDDYMDTYFDVSNSDAARSGLSRYDADAGFKDVTGTLFVHFTPGQKWGLAAFGKYSRLLGDAEDSPVVSDEGDENQWAGGVAVTYRF